MRKLFNGFYKTVKADSGYIRFFFITGCVKLSNLSIFSAMNNLKDISMDRRFAGAFGYTDEEVERFFSEGIDENWERCGYRTKEEFIEAIKDYYDGYRFSPESDTRVYNPVSLGSFFSDDCIFRNYWNATGVTTLAVNIAVRHDLSGYFENSIMAASGAFSSFDISCVTDPGISEGSIAVLLYYAGYLTMEYEEDGILYFGFPNKEIKTSFASSLLSRYVGIADFMEFWLAEFRAMCRTGRAEGVCEKLMQYFNAFSYELIGDEPERFYHSVFHAIFVIGGISAISEDRGPRGRADELIMAGNHLWIFELKVDGSVDEALKQIEDRGYADKYAYLLGDGVKVHKVGISFSSQKRAIEEWKAEILC